MKIGIQQQGAVCALGLALAAAGVGVHAAPVAGVIAAGSGDIQQFGGNTWIRQSSLNLVINWASFSIAAGERVTFDQSAGAIALNRVLGSEVSRIDGGLFANGQVWILNPNGVLFGNGAQVNATGLVASTLALSDADFMAGVRTFSANGSQGHVINRGSLSGGYVALLGKQVSNEGTVITTNGVAALAAGDKVSLSFDGNRLMSVQVDGGTLNALVQNKGVIRATDGSVILTATAKDALLGTVVNNEGVIEAKGIGDVGGTIQLLGGMNGGTVLAGGTLDASASGGFNGGFIETSGAHVKVPDNARIGTWSEGGTTGTWRIGANDFTIAAGGGDVTGQALGNLLAGTNIRIATAGTGDIRVNDAVGWGSDSRLTLDAARNIDVNAALTATGNGAGLVLNHGDYANTGTVAAGANYNIKAPITLGGANASLAINGAGYTLIRDAAGLQAMGGDLNGHYALAGNIDARETAGWNGGEGFSPVGTWGIPFRGALHGLGHTITGLTIDSVATYAYVGLFGVTNGSTLRDFGLVGGKLRVAKADLVYLGNLTGIAFNTTIDNVFATSEVTTDTRNSYVGGLVAELAQSSLRNSYATGNVTATGVNSYVGGLVGSVYLNATVSNAYATGDVNGNGNGNQVGGLAGYVYASALGDVYATGRVTGNGVSGGLVGYSDGATVRNAHATGDVAGGIGLYNGGLIGQSLGTTVNNAYATGAVQGAQRSANGGLIGFADGGSVVGNVHATGKVTASEDKTTNGGLIGRAYDTRVDNAYATGAVEGNGNEGTSGGLIGASRGGSVGSAYALGNVSGGAYAGGLVGSSDQTTFSNVYASGDVSGGDVAGGLVGNASKSSISDAHASGKVFGGSFAGGLVGVNSLGTVRRGYASGMVSGDQTVGGLMGRNVAAGAGTGLIAASFWLAGNTAHGLGIGMEEGTVDGLTRGLGGAEARSLATYTAAGWDIGATGGTGTLWRIYEGSTGPLLRGFLKPVTVTASGSGSKTYDGTVASGTLGYTASDGAASLLGSLGYASSSAHAGNYRTSDGRLTLSGLYSSQQGYDISHADASLDIAKANLVVSSGNVVKTYDGTTSAAGSATVAGGTLYGTDSLSGGSFAFTDRNAGGGKTVTAGGVTVNDGNGGGNYIVSYVANTGSTINAAVLGASGAGAASKTYDGTTDTTVTGGRLHGVLAGDTVSLSGSGHFSDRNAGTGKTVFLGLSGIDAGNYVLAGDATATADIARAALTVTANNDERVAVAGGYRGGNGVRYSGFVAGENSSVLGGRLVYGGSAQGAAQAGSYAITAGGLDADNYAIRYVDGTLVLRPSPVSADSRRLDALADAHHAPVAGGEGTSPASGPVLVRVADCGIRLAPAQPCNGAD